MGKRGPKPEKLHGTEARARRHYRDGEKPCLACLIAGAQVAAQRKVDRLAALRDGAR